MRRAIRYSSFFAMTLLVSFDTLAQVEAARTRIDADRPYFVDAISFASSDRSRCRLDVFAQVSYENLNFVKRGDMYEASYDMTIALYDSASRLVSEKLWTEMVKPVTFEVSVSPKAYSLTQRTFEILPGRYHIVTLLRDNETKTTKRLLREITIPDYSSSPFSLSDIMLVSRLTLEGEKRTIVPTISSNVGTVITPFHIFFEAYTDQVIDSMKFVATVMDEKKGKKIVVDTLYNLSSGRNQLFMSIDQSRLPLGDYVLYVQAFPGAISSDTAKESMASTSRSFEIRWMGMPLGVKDLDLAIDQIQYIAEDSEMKNIRAAKTVEEKQKRFLDFWKSKDPNPNTPRNEKMEEYYSRIEYANKHFAHYIEGWRTDMGMVFIIFGSPNNVDRHPFDIDAKPYEVWSYYELNHQFVFVDETGFGDYRLVTPIWEVWKRPRY
jgi:GWxTD domain-containing protein